jgi:DMSO/TMAO reductase YedYZ molybdopterin-dependent catalytic subunit
MPSKARSIDRRRLLIGAMKGTALLTLAGCDSLSRTEWFPNVLRQAEHLTRRVQRFLTPRAAMAREYSEADRSTTFPANGNTKPESQEYQAHAADGFARWRLEVGGLVRRPASYSLLDLQALPSRTQITRHDCVEGWSAIGKWTGVPLDVIVTSVQPLPSARYVVLYCADTDEDGVAYYESVDVEDARHAQTILAYAMNDVPLPVAHGAPLRLRVERQLGYKHA